MSDPHEDPDSLAEARALVMVRDDATGGWVPMGGGGLCKVSVRKGTIPGSPDQMYFIFAQRISDDSVVICSFITKDFEYNRVMPTFHHWKMRDSKFGLAFETLADAKAFDRGIRAAVGAVFGDTDDDPSRPRASELDDDETLELPVLGVDSRSASESSLRDSSKTTPQEQAAQMSHFFNPRSDADSPTLSQKYDYLQLAADQESTYPNAGGSNLVQQDASGSPKEEVAEGAPENAEKPTNKDEKKTGRHRCRYCQEIYVEENNKRGACEYAPDCMRTTIDEVACVRAARCMMYHCMSDEEGEFAQHPCECTCQDDGGFRWMALAFLSIFVPCLCLYPPLSGCHWCCLRVGLCGGRHRSAS